MKSSMKALMVAIIIGQGIASAAAGLTMAVLPTNGGTTNPSIGIHNNVDTGIPMDISAASSLGFTFNYWSAVPSANAVFGNASQASTTLTISGSCVVTAAFTAPKVTLAMTVLPLNSAVTTPTGETTVNSGEAVSIACTPNTGYTFNNWTATPSGNAVFADANSASTTVTLSGNTMVTANLVQQGGTVILNVTPLPSAGGMTNPTGASAVNPDTPIAISAAANSGYSFYNWTAVPAGNASIGDANAASTTISLSGNVELSANFLKTYQVVFAASPANAGTTNPSGTTSQNTSIPFGISAPANTGYIFIDWEAAPEENATIVSKTSATTSASVTGDVALTANFAETATLTMIASPIDAGATVPVVGTSELAKGSTLNISATPLIGYHFAYWLATGSINLANPNLANTTATVHDDSQLTANFAIDVTTVNLTMAVNPSASGTTAPTAGSTTNIPANAPYAITATAKPGYTFSDWTAFPEFNATFDNQGEANTNVTPKGDVIVSAKFIADTSITVTAPDGGEIWQQGAVQNITWDSTGTTGNIKIELFRNDSEDPQTPVIAESTDDDGSYEWTIPAAQSASPFYKVKITSLGSAVSDSSDNYFSITDSNALITVDSPLLGDKLQIGNAQNVAWTATGTTDNLNIDLYSNSVFSANIASNLAFNSSPYIWTPPVSTTPGINYEIRISSATTPSLYGDSGLFTLNSTGETATLTTARTPDENSYGTVLPAPGAHLVDTNEQIDILAQPDFGSKFVRWLIDSANPNIAIAGRSTALTTGILSGNAKVTALFADDGTFFNQDSSTVKVILKDSKANSDSLTVKKGSLTGQERPETYNVIKAYFNDYMLDMSNGTIKASSDGLKITVKGTGADGVTKFSLTLDFKKALWDLSITKANISPTGLYDSIWEKISVYLEINDNIFGGTVSTDQSAKWSFSNKKGDNPPTELLKTGVPWTGFAVTQAAASCSSTKTNTDSASAKGTCDQLAGFTTGDAVIVYLDNWKLDLSDLAGEWKTSKDNLVYSYKGSIDKTNSVTLKLDFKKKTWDFKISKTLVEGLVNSKNGIDFRMIIGKYEGAQNLGASISSTLSYPQK